MENDLKVEVEVPVIVREVSRLNLQPGEVLSVTIKGDDLSASDLHGLQDGIKSFFPNNKVMLFMMRHDQDIKFEVIKGETNESDTQ